MKAAGQRDKSGRFRLSPAFILVPNRIPNCTAEREKSRRRGAVPSRLPRPFQRPAPEGQREKLIYLHPRLPPAAGGLAVRGLGPRQGDAIALYLISKIGRASCRERVCQSV